MTKQNWDVGCEDFLPSQVAWLVSALSQYARVAGSNPDEET